MMKIKDFLRAHPVVFPLTLIIFVFVFLIMMVGSGLVSRQVSFFSRGAGVESVDPENSLIFASPLSVSTSTVPVSVRVFLRDKDTVAVSGVDVKLATAKGSIAPVNGESLQATTNENGMASFSIVLSELTPATLTVVFGPQETPLPKTITIQVVSL